MSFCGDFNLDKLEYDALDSALQECITQANRSKKTNAVGFAFACASLQIIFPTSSPVK